MLGSSRDLHGHEIPLKSLQDQYHKARGKPGRCKNPQDGLDDLEH